MKYLILYSILIIGLVSVYGTKYTSDYGDCDECKILTGVVKAGMLNNQTNIQIRELVLDIGQIIQASHVVCVRIIQHLPQIKAEINHSLDYYQICRHIRLC